MAAEPLDQRKLDAFADYARSTWKRSGVPGMALAVVQGDREVLSLTLGTREAVRDQPITRETVFPLASVSKTFGSATIAALIADGVVGWDDPIIAHNPAFRLREDAATLALSLRDGLSHRSGLAAFSGDDLERFGYGRTEILSRLRYLEPAMPFRTRYAYQNFMLTAAVEAGAISAGWSFEDLIEHRLFQPLGMKTASARYADFASRENRVTPHILDDQENFRPGPDRRPDPQAPAGGISASVDDMVPWLRFQLAEGRLGSTVIVEPAAIRETHKPHTIIGENQDRGAYEFYAMGWRVMRFADLNVVWHEGAFTTGAHTLAMLIPEHGIGLVVLTNAFPVGLPTVLGERLVALVRGDGEWKDRWPTVNMQTRERIASLMTAGAPPSPPDAAPMGPALRYIGTYTNPYYGRIAIQETNGQLALRLGRAEGRRPLRAYDGDILLDESERELVIFTNGPDDRAMMVWLEEFAGRAEPLFKRIE